MKNKITLLIISVASIALIAILGIKFNFNDTAKKAKADITYPTENGLQFSCDKFTANVNEEITCTVVGHFDFNVSGISNAKLDVLGLDIVSIETASGWVDMFETSFNETEIEELKDVYDFVNPKQMIDYMGNKSAGNFDVLTIKLKSDTPYAHTGNLSIVSAKNVEGEFISIIDDQNEEHLIDNWGRWIEITSSEGGSSLSSINTLESLTISSGTLSPTFTRNIYSYNATVENSVSSLSVNAVPTDENSTVDGLGVVNLSEGENRVTVTVAAQNGDVATYTIIVTREAAIDTTKSSDNTLKSLSLDNATLSPAFNSSKTEYTAVVENNVTSVNVAAIANDSKATVAISGNENLQVGNNTITVKVTAEDNSIKPYTIVVTRKSTSGDVACTLQITSSAYKVDNNNLIIDAVNRDDTADTIKNNLSVSCGSITVNGDKVIISDGVNVKSYTINRVFIPKTGNNAIKYVAIIAGIVLIIGVLIFVKKKMDK